MKTRLLILPVLASSVMLRRTPLTPLKVTGKDAGAFLHAMLSADVSTLPQNAHVDACLLTGQSTLTDLITIARCQEEWLLLCEDASTVVRELEKRRVMEDVAFSTIEKAVFDVLNGDDAVDADLAKRRRRTSPRVAAKQRWRSHASWRYSQSQRPRRPTASTRKSRPSASSRTGRSPF